jgi:hypothetical protein
MTVPDPAQLASLVALPSSGSISLGDLDQPTTLAAIVTAVVLCMAIVPVMIRAAPALGMVDRPDPRKVHRLPVPRVGGIGIVIGALTSLALWLPLDPLSVSYLIGSLVLFAFGAWDDRKELGRGRSGGVLRGALRHAHSLPLPRHPPAGSRHSLYDLCADRCD